VNALAAPDIATSVLLASMDRVADMVNNRAQPLKLLLRVSEAIVALGAGCFLVYELLLTQQTRSVKIGRAKC
jgi:hypothetical protein